MISGISAREWIRVCLDVCVCVWRVRVSPNAAVRSRVILYMYELERPYY